VGRRRERRHGFLDEEQLARREQATVDRHLPRDPEQLAAEPAEEGEQGQQAAEPDRESLRSPAPERAAGMTVLVPHQGRRPPTTAHPSRTRQWPAGG
jgi:hypothetical protein